MIGGMGNAGDKEELNKDLSVVFIFLCKTILGLK
jgi:hypothetical protein